MNFSSCFDMFASYLMGGFECSTHRNSQNRRVDVIEATRHDRFAERDYERLLSVGMRTARDGVRWHLIEKELPRLIHRWCARD